MDVSVHGCDEPQSPEPWPFGTSSSEVLSQYQFCDKASGEFWGFQQRSDIEERTNSELFCYEAKEPPPIKSRDLSWDELVKESPPLELIPQISFPWLKLEDLDAIIDHHDHHGKVEGCMRHNPICNSAALAFTIFTEQVETQAQRPKAEHTPSSNKPVSTGYRKRQRAASSWLTGTHKDPVDLNAEGPDRSTTLRSASQAAFRKSRRVRRRAKRDDSECISVRDVERELKEDSMNLVPVQIQVPESQEFYVYRHRVEKRNKWQETKGAGEFSQTTRPVFQIQVRPNGHGLPVAVKCNMDTNTFVCNIEDKLYSLQRDEIDRMIARAESTRLVI